MLKSAFGGLSTGVCKQPLKYYVGVFFGGPGWNRNAGGRGCIIHAVTVFSCSRVYPLVFFPCTRAVALFRASTGLSAGFLSLYPRGCSFPRFRVYIRGFSFPVPARLLFSALPRVYPRVFSPCTHAAALFRASTGIVIRVPPRLRRGPPCYVSAGFPSLYPRGDFLLVSSKKQKKN